MTTPAPMTAERLEEIREIVKGRDALASETDRRVGYPGARESEMLAHIDALTARIAELERERDEAKARAREPVTERDVEAMRRQLLLVGYEGAAKVLHDLLGRAHAAERELTTLQEITGGILTRAALIARAEALESELAAARKVEDGEVEEALGWLDKPQLYPSGRIKKIAALVRQLYAALKEAERLLSHRTKDMQRWIDHHDARADAAEAKLESARRDALEEAAAFIEADENEPNWGQDNNRRTAQTTIEECAALIRALQTKDTRTVTVAALTCAKRTTPIVSSPNSRSLAMTDLRELEKRLEEATGPDRELDCLIWGRDRGLEITWQNDCMIAQGEGAIGWIDPGKHQRNFYTNRSERGPGSIPAYTASLDAAVALVERCLPGWGWRCGQGVTQHWVNGRAVTGWAFLNRVHPDHADKKDEAGAYAETAPLALCLALIRALIAKGDRHD